MADTSLSFTSSSTTYQEIPALKKPQEQRLPAKVRGDRMTSFCAFLNTFIASYGIVTFEYRLDWYIVKRITKYNDKFFLVVFNDFNGKEHKVFTLRYKSFNIFLGG